jgi:hypothetical protein
MKGALDMAIEWKKQRELKNVSGDIMDRFVDGRIVDPIEMHERMMILQQFGVVLVMPKRPTHHNGI